MKRKSYAALAAFLALAFASTIQAQPQPGGWYYHIKLLDSVSVTTGDWNALCEVNNYVWIVGDSGKVRKYTVTYGSAGTPILNLSNSFSLGSKYTLCDVCFPTNQYGYIVGYEKREIGVEVPSVTVPGKGKIWYTHNYGASPGDWQLVDTLDMPEAFRKKAIPCLSVDFYNEERGYVGCGCGYVLRSIDYGESWRALRDTMLPTKSPWDSVGFHIGSIPRGYHVGEGYYNHFGDWYWDIKAPNSIPRGYHVGEGYYNHFGDWYWDIKAPNANKVYVASDNNGVFFETTDGGVSLPIPEIFSR
jgi:hypothetical protein